MNYPVHNLEDILLAIRLKVRKLPEPAQSELLQEMQKMQGLLKTLRQWEAEKRVERREATFHANTPVRSLSVANKRVR